MSNDILLQQAWQALEEVKDPEFPISVTGMGLIRGLTLNDGVARVELTFTSMGCPWKEWIERDIRAKLSTIPGIDRVEIEVVWNKPWSRHDLRRDAKEKLQQMGIAP